MARTVPSRPCATRFASPLLDQGALLKDAQTVLVHLSGGEDLTLFEIELLMQRLQKFVPENAHVLFGAAVDPAMGDSLSLTLISALPEDSLAMAPRETLSQSSSDSPLLDPSQGFTPPPVKAATPEARPEVVKSEPPRQFRPPSPSPNPFLPSRFPRRPNLRKLLLLRWSPNSAVPSPEPPLPLRHPPCLRKKTGHLPKPSSRPNLKPRNCPRPSWMPSPFPSPLRTMSLSALPSPTPRP